jgi:hypothetical protein
MVFFTSSKPALGSTQPPIQWVTGAFSPGLKLLGREADTHFQLLSRSVKCGYIHPLPHTPSRRSA